MFVVGSQNICELQIAVLGEFWNLWGWRRTRDHHNCGDNLQACNGVHKKWGRAWIWVSWCKKYHRKICEYNWRNWLMIHDDHYSCLLWLIACCEGIMNISQAEKERKRGGIKQILRNNTSTRSHNYTLNKKMRGWKKRWKRGMWGPKRRCNIPCTM